MNDPELFELCKEVYEKIGWKHTGRAWYSNAGEVHDKESVWVDGEVFDKPANVPLYNSDYILGKLPGDYELKPLNGEIEATMFINDGWINQASDTPLKALLKLVIALHKAGEL